MIKDSTDKTPIIICELLIEEMSKESCYNMTNMRVQRYLDERILKTTLISEVSLNDDIEVKQMMILFTYCLPMRPRLLPKLWQQIWKHLLRLTCAQYVICHFPLKMNLDGVLIVIMFHSPQTRDHTYLKTMINQNYISVFSIQ